MGLFRYTTKIALLTYLLFSLIACVNTSEYQEYELDDEIIIAEKEVQVETKPATQTDEETVRTAEEEQIQYIQEAKTYEKFSTASGYLKNALKHMQHGNEDAAKWSLEQALELDPKSKISMKLLQQISADALNEFGIISFEYKVQYGDSLSKLAKKYLKDPLLFYMLAKYNEITNPSHLVVGQVINIPGAKPEEPEVKKPELAATKVEPEEIPAAAKVSSVAIHQETNVQSEVASSIELAEKDYKKADYQKVIISLEDSQTINEHEPQAVKLLVLSYYEKSKQQLEAGNIQEAKYLLLKAAELEPDNPKVNMALIDMDESVEVENLYEKGVQAFADNRVEEAYEYLDRVLELNPYHKRAVKKQQEIKPHLVSHYYKQALMAQRKHKLDEAIEYWDEVLALDENNDNAKIYRNKAVGLKMKLENFAAK